ncbi:ABC transporter substrate-binding protein [Paenibacillus segetis]|uniref:Sugar ABC transporter substrate-binding protein n=1 Tax=Paenibacillus segetis TaxID=1325360 RepID=A0ABQ1Y4C7_9BACL|nr:extracellular solute-binding protein [Paenibacillus segetis]GGH11971.1 sugar ABC transporter substrate-binding protein [Paenibacillus segetis]
MLKSSKGWVLLLTVMLAVSLTACGGGNTANSGSSKEEEKADKQVTLRYSSYLLDTAQAGKAYYDAIAEFETQNPNIKIETDFIQNANYTAGIKTRLLGGEKMDIFDTWSPSLFAEFNALGEQVYLDLTGSDFLSDFLPASLEPVTIDGKVFGAPEVMHSDGLLYNKTMFEELGLQVPQTWDEFIALCETLKQKGIIPVAMDSEWWVPQFFWGSIMSNSGADANWTKKLESGEVKVSDPIFVDAIQKHKELVEKGYVPKEWTGMKHEQSKDLVGQGKAAMIITGTWDIPSLMERNTDIDIDFMMVPGNEKTVPNINIGTYRVINANTEHPEEAKKFISFMNGKVNQEKLALGTLAVPSIAGSKVDNPVVEKIAAVVTRDDATLYWPHTVSTESLQVKILEGVNKYLAGQSLDDAIAEIQKSVDDARNNR